MKTLNPIVILILSVLFISIDTAVAAPSKENQQAIDIRSTFLMHIVNYTLGISEDEKKQQNVFCFLENEPFNYYVAMNKADLLAASKTPVTVSQVDSVSQADKQHCRYLFVSRERENDTLYEQIKQVNDSIVTIGESYDFINNGGVVSLVERAQKIKIIINKNRYKKIPVKFSARLLKYANFTG